jgi:hypothetical protein
VAGIGSAGGLESGLALATPLNQPYGLVFAHGELYVSNYQGHRIQKITGENIVTVAGDGTPDSTGTNGSMAATVQVNPQQG